MIEVLASLIGWEVFIHNLCADPEFSHPMLAGPEKFRKNLFASPENPEKCVLGVTRGGIKCGLFVFLVLKDENYLEMTAGLSRDEGAYRELAEYLEAAFAGFAADFVFNHGNRLISELLRGKNAAFNPEQQKMVLISPPPPVDTTGIELLCEGTYAQYCAIHEKGLYWTGEKVAAAPDRFTVFLAVDSGEVVGYLDLTNCYEENEPVDVFVKEEYRRRGWGRKLLSRAIEWNRPRGMGLLVDTENEPAIRLYRSLGFEKVPGLNNVTANWNIPKKNILKEADL